MADEQPAPQPPPQPTVGGMPVAQAGALELVRGAGTTGLLMWLLYTALQRDVEALGDRIDDIGARVGDVAIQVHTLQIDVTRLQATQDAASTPPAKR